MGRKVDSEENSLSGSAKHVVTHACGKYNVSRLLALARDNGLAKYFVC